MEIIDGIENINTKFPCAITVGTFDGIHLGHKKIISRLLEIANEKNLCSTMVTFHPHPKLVVKSKFKEAIKLITDKDEKIEIIRESGIDRLVIIKFDHDFSQTNYRQFIKSILLDKLMAKVVVVGYDHAFGKNREGNFDNLVLLSDEFKFEVEKVGPFEIKDQVVSSTTIRNALTEGEVEKAAEYLGRLYSVSGKVVPGDGRGKKLNFHTANIDVENPNKLIPGKGVYAVDVKHNDQMYKGMMNIGFRPTFGSDQLNIETHIFDFKKEIYGEKLTVFFKKRLRDEIKFNSVEELITQLEIDKQNSLNI
ncbi:MAG: bifunctional riboflavin kinase/FAD synthetase [Calditrichaceae bacterium]